MAHTTVDPSQHFLAVTPHATNLITYTYEDVQMRPKAFQIGGAGVIDLVNSNGGTVSFTVVAGELLPISSERVLATSTATLIVAIF